MFTCFFFGFPWGVLDPKASTLRAVAGLHPKSAQGCLSDVLWLLSTSDDLKIVGPALSLLDLLRRCFFGVLFGGGKALLGRFLDPHKWQLVKDSWIVVGFGCSIQSLDGSRKTRESDKWLQAKPVSLLQ